MAIQHIQGCSYVFPNISYFAKIMFGNVGNERNTDVKYLQTFINVCKRLVLQGHNINVK